MTYTILMLTLSKKYIPFSVFVVIFVIIIGIGIGIAAYEKKAPSILDTSIATTTFGIPVSNSINTPTTQTNTNNQYTISAIPSSESQENIPSNTFTPTPQATISVLYPTNNQTLINDPQFHTPLATILWKTKSTNIASVAIDLQDQTGTTIKTIVSRTANTGTFVWSSDAALTNGSYRLRIRGVNTPYGDTGTVDEGTSESFAIASPSATQHPNSVWQTYINPQYGFSFIYPDDFSFASINVQYPGTTLLKLEPKLNYYIHSNDIETVDASNIVIAAKPATSVSCPSPAETTGAQGYVYGNMDTVQGKYLQFTKVKRNDFGINNQYSRYVDYFTLYKGTCYSFKFTAHVVRLPFSTNALYQAPDKLENDISRLSANVEQMILSLAFLQ